MRHLACTILACAVALALTAPAHAASGDLKFSWTSCAAGPTNLTVLPGQTVRLVASVSGHSDPTLAHEVWLSFGNLKQGVPDAWRFDAAGCQGPARATLEILAPASLAKTCASFETAGGSNGSPVPAILGLDFWPVGFGPPTTLLRIYAARVYNHPNAPDPARTYFLMDAVFDQSMGANGATNPGTTCGGLEQTMVFQLYRANYILSDGIHPDVEVAFTVPQGGGMLTVNAGSGDNPLPAAASTWGAVKAQYRH